MNVNFYPAKNSLASPILRAVIVALLLFFFQTGYSQADSAAIKRSQRFAKNFGPAKVDFITTFKEKYTNANAFFWSKSLKAGFGTVYKGDTSGVAHYGGAWFRPLSFTKYKGDLIIYLIFFRFLLL